MTQPTKRTILSAKFRIAPQNRVKTLPEYAEAGSMASKKTRTNVPQFRRDALSGF
jgi:hypothetical protein